MKLQTIYKGLFTLCSYLKTKESYDKWITRRVWGFRHQISKEKYLKKVGRKYQEASGEIPLHYVKWRLCRQYYQSLLFDCGRK